MTLTYRRDLTRKLTTEEIDGNFDHVIDSANQTFLQSGTGTLTRTVEEKLREIKSLDDFGATGDGTTDDATDVQEAFTWLGGASYRCLVGTPGKTYRVGSKVSVTGSYSVKRLRPLLRRP